MDIFLYYEMQRHMIYKILIEQIIFYMNQISLLKAAYKIGVINMFLVIHLPLQNLKQKEQYVLFQHARFVNHRHYVSNANQDFLYLVKIAKVKLIIPKELPHIFIKILAKTCLNDLV